MYLTPEAFALYSEMHLDNPDEACMQEFKTSAASYIHTLRFELYEAKVDTDLTEEFSV